MIPALHPKFLSCFKKQRKNERKKITKKKEKGAEKKKEETKIFCTHSSNLSSSQDAWLCPMLPF